MFWYQLGNKKLPILKKYAFLQRELFHGWRSVQRDNGHQGGVSTVLADGARLGADKFTTLQEYLPLLQELFSITLRQQDMGHGRLVRGPPGATDDDHR